MIIKLFSWGLVLLFVIFGGMAMVTGAQVKNSDLLNQTLNSAQARHTDMLTRYESQLNNLNLQEQTAETEANIARVRLDMQREENQFQLDMQRLAVQQKQDLEFREKLHNLELILIGLAATCAIGVLSLSALFWSWFSASSSGQPPKAKTQPKAAPERPAPTPHHESQPVHLYPKSSQKTEPRQPVQKPNPSQPALDDDEDDFIWNDAEYRSNMRDAARLYEQANRRLDSSMGNQPAADDGRRGDGDGYGTVRK